MKVSIFRTLVVLSLAMTALGTSARAQYVQHAVSAEIPFDFTAGSKVLPAGRYTLVCVAPDYLEVRDEYSQVWVVLSTRTIPLAEKSPSARLEFFVVDGEYSLAEIRIEDESTGYELAVRKASSVARKERSHTTLSASGTGNK
jgi:hypothetical protein